MSRLQKTLILGVLIVIAAVTLVTTGGRRTESRMAAEGPGPSLLVAATSAPHQEARPLLDAFSRAFENAAAVVNPSVVPIFSEATVTVQNPFGAPDEGLHQFFGEQFFQELFGRAPGEQRQTVHALGSGVIVSPDGYILTNHHVVEGAQTLTVVMANGDRKDANIVGADPETDLALVKVDGRGLPAAKLGDSDGVIVGQWVIAVGNPFQLLHTTTAGIISARGRSSVGIADYEDFIQTDAAINPGNSGGALADLDGRVIGINAAISSPTGGSVGLGFAIPINMAKEVMEQLKAHGKVVRGYLGVVLQTLTPELSEALGAGTARGVLVGDVGTDTPAEHAGFQRGDVITEFQGQPVDSVVELRNEVAGTAPGTRVEFKVLRAGREQSLRATLAEQPQPTKGAAESPATELSAATPMGLSVETLTPGIAAQLGYGGEHGAVVDQVQPGSPADAAGLQQGDLIKEVNRREIRTAQDLVDRLQALGRGESAALLVRRGASTFYLALRATP